jgi:multimeric flavodoxin WrbA
MDFIYKIKSFIQFFVQEYEGYGSDLEFLYIQSFRIHIGKYNPLKIKSYLPLPKEILNKKCCINIKNEDEKCFMYCILYHIFKNEIVKDADRITKYNKYVDTDIYKKLQECDGFIVYTPIHWYSVSTPVKAMFDRLVCMSATLPAEFAMKELGKDPKKTIPAYKEGIYDDKLKNWLEGKYAAFFIHGDDGGDDSQRLNAPKSFNKEYDKLANDPDVAIMPIVATCRYSGIFVPDDLIFGTLMNKGLNYAEANEKFKEDQEQIKEKAKDLINKLASYLKK